jgi:hypothetical protein
MSSAPPLRSSRPTHKTCPKIGLPRRSGTYFLRNGASRLSNPMSGYVWPDRRPFSVRSSWGPLPLISLRARSSTQVRPPRPLTIGTTRILDAAVLLGGDFAEVSRVEPPKSQDYVIGPSIAGPRNRGGRRGLIGPRRESRTSRIHNLQKGDHDLTELRMSKGAKRGA